MIRRNARAWDRYVATWRPETDGSGDADARAAAAQGRARLDQPGDEWGYPAEWDRLVYRLLAPAGLEGWIRIVELGPGSGKYTGRMLAAASRATVHAFDVSNRYLEICRAAQAEYVRSGRLGLHLIDQRRPWFLSETMEAEGWGEVDAVVSIDAMVHVDLNVLALYWLDAARILRPGGKLIMTLADATTDEGFRKLIGELAFNFTQPVNCQFEWLSPDLVRSVLERLGFDVERCESPGRDIELVASLEDVHAAHAAAELVAPLPTRSQVVRATLGRWRRRLGL